MKKLVVSGLLGIGIMLSSCIKEPPCPVREGTRENVRFVLSSSAETRASETAFNPGDEIGVYAVERGTLQDVGNYADNKRFRYNGDTFLPVTESDQIPLPSNSTLQYYAYYPYTKEPGNAMAMELSVAANQKKSYTESDWVRAFYKATDNQSVVPLTFYHQMSLVEFTIERKNWEYEQWIENPGMIDHVEIPNVKTDYVMNLQNGKYETVKDKVTDVIMYQYDVTDHSVTFRALLPTQTIKKWSALFRIKIDRHEDIYYSFKNMTLMPGKMHVYTVNSYENPQESILLNTH